MTSSARARIEAGTEADRLGGVEIDDQTDRPGLLDRQMHR